VAASPPVAPEPVVASGSALAFAPGKLILFGEHAVVYGHPAVALAVDRGTTVSLVAVDGPTRIVAADVEDPRLLPALCTILPSEGLGVTLRSTLPVGRGMGSSAALAVALVRAWARWQGRSLDLDEIHQAGFQVERVFHGNPSGVDHAVSARGGAVCYWRRPPGPEIRAVPVAPLPLVVLDTGRAGDTGVQVAGVASRRPGVDPLLAAIGALALAQLPALAQGDLPSLGAAMRENHRLLQGIGVSTPALDALVALALAHGALGAKLAGAGGGGVVVALVPEPGPLLAAAAAAGVDAFPVGVHPSQER